LTFRVPAQPGCDEPALEAAQRPSNRSGGIAGYLGTNLGLYVSDGSFKGVVVIEVDTNYFRAPFTATTCCSHDPAALSAPMWRHERREAMAMRIRWSATQTRLCTAPGWRAATA